MKNLLICNQIAIIIFDFHSATFLSRYIGTLNGQLEDDPFMEILASKQGIIGQRLPKPDDNTFNGTSALVSAILDLFLFSRVSIIPYSSYRYS